MHLMEFISIIKGAKVFVNIFYCLINLTLINAFNRTWGFEVYIISNFHCLIEMVKFEPPDGFQIGADIFFFVKSGCRTGRNEFFLNCGYEAIMVIA